MPSEVTEKCLGFWIMLIHLPTVGGVKSLPTVGGGESLPTVGGESFAYYWSVVKVHFLHLLFSNLCMLSSMCGA